MKKIGELLKSEREKKGLALHEVGMALKINPKILKAIEEADAKNLPAKTFLRGFIRSYSQYLHLDVDQYMKLFQEEFGSTRPEEPKSAANASAANVSAPAASSLPNTKDAPQESPKVSAATVKAPPKEIAKTATSVDPKTVSQKSSQESTKEKTKKSALPTEGLSTQKIYTFVGSIVLILMIIFVARLVDKYQKESQRVKVEATNPIPADNKEPIAPSAPVTSMTNKESESVPMTPIAGTKAEEPQNLNKPIATIVIKPTPTTTPIVTPTQTPNPTITPKVSPTVTPGPLVVAPAQKPTEVIVEALNKVDVKYSFGDEKVEVMTLMADEIHTFKSKTGMTLEISDGGAVNLIVNGRDRGVPGSIGKPIKLSYPK